MADPRWLEVSLVVDGELAEALADLLSRYVEGGVVVESGIKFASIDDEGQAGGPVRVFGYIPVDDKLEVTRQKLENGLWHLGQIQPIADAAIPADRRPGLDDILEKTLSSHRCWEEDIDPASLDRAGENRSGGCSHRSEYGFWDRDASHHTVVPGNGGRILPTRD